MLRGSHIGQRMWTEYPRKGAGNCVQTVSGWDGRVRNGKEGKVNEEHQGRLEGEGRKRNNGVLSPSHTRLKTRLRPTCDRKMLQS